jgi:hypothetical protein
MLSTLVLLLLLVWQVEPGLVIGKDRQVVIASLVTRLLLLVQEWLCQRRG